MNCWHCNEELIWGADFDYEDYGMDGEGIVSNFSSVEVFLPLKEEVDEKKES